MAPETKKTGATPQTQQDTKQPSTQTNAVAGLVKEWEARREAAMAAKRFDNIDLIEYNGYRLTISINPDGNAALVLVSPRLSNRFVIADETVINYIIAILQAFKEREELRRATWTFLSKYGRITTYTRPSQALVRL